MKPAMPNYLPDSWPATTRSKAQLNRAERIQQIPPSQGENQSP